MLNGLRFSHRLWPRYSCTKPTTSRTAEMARNQLRKDCAQRLRPAKPTAPRNPRGRQQARVERAAITAATGVARSATLMIPEIVPPAALAIAVGTPVTQCPPHGPGRALISASGSYRGSIAAQCTTGPHTTHPPVGHAHNPLCVGCVPEGKVFSLISSLPSSLSVNDVPSLFE